MSESNPLIKEADSLIDRLEDLVAKIKVGPLRDGILAALRFVRVALGVPDNYAGDQD